MRYIKILLLLLVAGCAIGVQADKKKLPPPQKIYIFGFSASYADSVAFITDVMEVDSAIILSNGFLADRQIYSLQLANYVLENLQLPNSTNAVFFSKNKKTLDKKYQKVNRKYQQSKTLALIYLGEDDFKFSSVEHIESEVVEVDEQGTPVPNAQATKKSKKQKKQKKAKK